MKVSPGSERMQGVASAVQEGAMAGAGAALAREGFGGGAAGICAAISAARAGNAVVICEKMSQLGKKILAKPLHAQMEQTSNAAALEQLGYGHCMNNLDISAIEHWLHHSRGVYITFPNVAELLVQWIQKGMPHGLLIL